MVFKKGHKLGIRFKKGQIPWNKENHIYLGGGFKKGSIPWNKGKKCSYVSERNRINNPSKKGDKNYYWKGGKEIFRKRQALLRDDYICQICGLREPQIMVVDHIKPKSIFPELKFEINNLITLCPNCHARKTIREKKQKYDKSLYE